MSHALVMLSALLAAMFAIVIGALVTLAIHLGYSPPFWRRRLGATRWRIGDLPIGGTLVALLAGALAPGAEATVLAGVAVGLNIGVLIVAYVHPLPRATSAKRWYHRP